MKDATSISAVDLFCGVGGLTHGLVRGGVSVRVGVDLDPACQYPYEANNSAVFLESDVKELAAADIATFLPADQYSLLAGCAPCQSFSTYSRSGRSKKRELDWQLVSSFGRLVKEIQPHFVTMENVPQLADHPVFGDFQESLRGYKANWSIVECSAIGVPQARRRLVLIASRLGFTAPALRASAARARTVRDTIYGLTPLSAGESDPRDPLHTASSLSDLNLRRIRASKPGGTWRDWDEDLQAACHRRDTGSTFPSVYGRMEWDKAAPTITTQCFGYGNGRFGHPEQDRAISLREAAMLQTFPRSYKFVEPGGPIRFNHLGRLIGNAVPVRLGEAIARAFVRHVRELESAGSR